MKYCTPKIRQKCFTLMEVIVAMAVFSIMMGILLQFFASTQKLWSRAENKNDLYRDARVAMDLMATALQSNYYSAHTTLFVFGTANEKTDALYFPVKMPHDYGSGEDLYYLSFIAQNGKLYIRTFGSKHSPTRYKEMFTAIYDATPDAAKSAALVLRTDLKYVSNQSQEVINGVISMKCTPIHANPGSTSPVTFAIKAKDDEAFFVPFAVSLELELLSGDILKRWKELGGTFKSSEIGINSETEAAKELRLANQHKFSRIVYLGFQ